MCRPCPCQPLGAGPVDGTLCSRHSGNTFRPAHTSIHPNGLNWTPVTQQELGAEQFGSDRCAGLCCFVICGCQQCVCVVLRCLFLIFQLLPQDADHSIITPTLTRHFAEMLYYPFKKTPYIVLYFLFFLYFSLQRFNMIGYTTNIFSVTLECLLSACHRHSFGFAVVVVCCLFE